MRLLLIVEKLLQIFILSLESANGSFLLVNFISKLLGTLFQFFIEHFVIFELELKDSGFVFML